MGQAASIKTSVRTIITKLGSSASLYSFSSATTSYNDEGEVTVTWGSASTIKVISSNHYSLRRLLARQGEENDEGDRVVLVRDDVTIAHRDKLVIGTDVYLVHEVKKIDPIEDTLVFQRCVLMKNVRYT